MFKRFKDGDLVFNRVQAHPKVEFFLNSGSVNSIYHQRKIRYSGSNISDGQVGLYDIVHALPLALPLPVTGNFLITETGSPLLTEGGLYLEWEDELFFDETFEFTGGWDETVASIPEPLFAVADHDEAFEFADSWDETVVGTPSPTFASPNLDEDYDNGWDGT